TVAAAAIAAPTAAVIADAVVADHRDEPDADDDGHDDEPPASTPTSPPTSTARHRPAHGAPAAAAATSASTGPGGAAKRPRPGAAVAASGGRSAAASSATETPAVWTPDLVDKPDALDDPQLERFLKATEPQPDDVEPKRRLPRLNGRWVGISVKVLIAVVVALGAAVALRVYVVAPYYIPSESMEPTLHGCAGCDNDRVLVDKFSYHFTDVSHSDIVVFDRPKNFQAPEDVLIKRVIGLPGDTIQLRNGRVILNGTLLDEGYVKSTPQCPGTSQRTDPRTSVSKWTVPPGDVFVMGDNRCDSEDSRRFGPIPESSIIGRAFMVIWPWKHFGFLH
ncbi:MAG: signal peptidase I, partial [Jatrophihabitans sp.]|uniref:signal peptidase I n=1 Tax=Jatrophihabitans sp. TaxID=1932789 RepID=UPI003F7CE1AC